MKKLKILFAGASLLLLSACKSYQNPEAWRQYVKGLDWVSDIRTHTYSYSTHQNTRLQQGIERFSRAIEIGDSYYEAHLERAKALIHLKRYPEALVDLDSALLSPELKSEAYENIAVSYLQLKQYAQASQALEKLLQGLDLKDNKVNYQRKRRIISVLIQNEIALKNWQKAYQYAKEHRGISWSIAGQYGQAQLIEIQLALLIGDYSFAEKTIKSQLQYSHQKDHKESLQWLQGVLNSLRGSLEAVHVARYEPKFDYLKKPYILLENLSMLPLDFNTQTQIRNAFLGVAHD